MAPAAPKLNQAGPCDVPPVVKPGRLSALDFTKGALVLFMVLYHWLNYFYGFKDDIYKYLRFLTPSFIFISGFLISNVYLARDKVGDSRAPRRLFQRGLKILALFIGLNAGIALLFPHNGRIVFDMLSVRGLLAIYVAGTSALPGIGKAAAFPVLVPISYLLLMSSGLLVLARWYSAIFYWACGVLFLGKTILGLSDIGNGNLDLLAIGSLGIVFGYVPAARIKQFVRYWLPLVCAYLGYLVAISIWNVLYPLQVLGVCLTITLLYLLGAQSEEGKGVRGEIVLLGKYSLFAYVAQIAIVQALYRGFSHLGLDLPVMPISFVAAFGLTSLSVHALDRARKASLRVDQLYRAVFA